MGELNGRRSNQVAAMFSFARDYAEQAGFESLWFDDHLLADEGDWHDPKLEGWAALAALAPLTSTARPGTRRWGNAPWRRSTKSSPST